MKCNYKYCKLGGEVEKDIAIKVGRYYYHQECQSEREQKQQIEKLYYDRFQNDEPIQAARRAIAKYVHTDNYKPEYILFVLNEDIKLNSMFGLIYYLRDKRFEDKYYRAKAKMLKIDDDIKVQESKAFEHKKKNNKKSWGDIICP